MGGVRWGTLTLLVLDLMPIMICIVGGAVEQCVKIVWKCRLHSSGSGYC